MSTKPKESNASGCGCSPSEPPATLEKEPKLEDLIPIAVVIAAGCESCAEKMVTQALAQGGSWRHIQKTLGIVTHMQKLDCLTQAVGEEVVARMEKPLAAGRKTLQRGLAARRR